LTNLLARQQAMEEQNRQAQQQSSQQANQMKPLTEEDLGPIEELLLKDPKEGLALFKKELLSREVAPVMQALYQEVQQLRTDTTRNQLLGDDVNKHIYKKYSSEVESEMKRLAPLGGNTFQTALDLVKSKHLSDIVALEVAKLKETETANQQQVTVTTPQRPGNVNPNVTSAPPTEGKKKIYVDPKLMARKPLGMTDKDYIEYLRDKGVVK